MDKLIKRQKIRYRIRRKVSGTAVKPRLSVFRSNAEIYAQLIDDQAEQLWPLLPQEKKILQLKHLPKWKRVNWLDLLLHVKRLKEGLQPVFLTEVVIYTMVV